MSEALTHHLLGFAAPAVCYALVLLLHLVLPSRQVEGYARDEATGEPLSYRLNGLLVLIVVVAVWYATGHFELLAWDWLYQHRFSALAGAIFIGLLYTAVLVFRAPGTGKSLAADLFLGRVKNQQYWDGAVDAKMYLYLAGAVLLMLNALSCAAHHHNTFGDKANPGVYLHAALFTFFLTDYLWFERVHLYTYDLFAERLGFKLAWGCLAFYPFFYPVGLWTTAELPTSPLVSSLGTVWLVLSAVVFFCGWMLARGANMQKYFFKRFPEKAFLGITPEVVTDGNKALLCNGFWGISRHVNYLGEILMATGLALSLGQLSTPWPWLYPLYYVALLFPRERDDDRRCAEKYGPLWDKYRKRVPKRIIPGIY